MSTAMQPVKYSTLVALTAFSRRLAVTSSDAAAALLKCGRELHGYASPLPEVSAEAAGEAARRSVPMLDLPAGLELELEEFIADRGVKPKDARQLAQELTERLQSLSHTPQRGGFGVSTVAPARGGRLRGAELLAAREAFEAGQLLSMDDRAVNAALGLPPPLSADERHAPQMHKLAPKYKTESEIVAYIVSRMAPEYAVCRRVLDEAVRLLEAAEMLPGEAAVKWRPREALVYGAGVGAPVVAALESCSSLSLTRLVALEPSSLRQALGSRVEQAYRARQRQLQQHQQRDEGRDGDAPQGRSKQHAPGPLVSWVQALPPQSKAATDQRRRYDLVVAPYQLTILPTAAERERLVRELWDRCGDVLVLVEPGTPRGFAAVAEARELLLSRESRKRKQLEAAAAAASGGQHEAGAGSGADPRVIHKLRSAGAHVVAPCPHDGACPMQGRKRQWCHFSQPLLRPFFMQHALARPGDQAQGRGRALNVQDERFSYLVLRRGARPSFRTSIARDFDELGGKDLAAVSLAASPVLPARLPPRVVLSQVVLNRAAAAAAETAPSPDFLESRPRLEVREDAPLHGRTAVGGHKRGTSTAPRRVPLFDASECVDGSTSAQELQSSGCEVVASAPAVPDLSRLDPVSAQSSSAERFDGRDKDGGAGASPSGSAHGTAAPLTPGSVISAFARKYPAYGPGLVGRLAALQEAGIDWAGAGGKEEADSGDEPDATNSNVGPSGAAQRFSEPAELRGPQPVANRTAAYERDGGVSAAHHHDIDAALSMSVLGGVHTRTPDGRQAGNSSPGFAGMIPADAVVDEAVSAGSSSEHGHMLPVVSAPHLGKDEDDEVTLPDSFGGAEVETHGDQGGQQLSRDDVSDGEYDRAELQLVEQIYGAEAAVAWLKSRLGAGVPAADATEDDYEQDDDEQEGQAAEFGSQSGPASRESLRLAEAASYGWGRLVRSPRLRGGHVILDMCVGPQHHYPDSLGEGPAPAAEGPSDASAAAGEPAAVPTDATAPGGHGASGAGAAGDDGGDQGGAVSDSDPLQPAALGGRLVQQVVAKSARRGWMGAPAYRLARKLSWGDCWPDWYIRGHNARETMVNNPLQRAPEVEQRLGGRN